MSFNLLELSRNLGRPIGLLRLSRGAVVELYTDADRVVTRGGDDYLPLAGLARSEIRDSSQRLKNMLTLTLPVDAPVASWWRPYPPSGRVGVVWLATHSGDDEVNVEWIGRVVAPRFTDTLLQLNCEPSSGNQRSRSASMKWQYTCPLVVYSQGLGMCNADRALHATPAVLTSVAGSVIQAEAFGLLASGILAGGVFEWERPDGETEYRTILSHAGETVVLNYGSDTLEEDLAGTAFRGCPHNFAACRDDFENEPNFGGTVYAPIKTPFDGNPT
jgi:hypothetical protein